MPDAPVGNAAAEAGSGFPVSRRWHAEWVWADHAPETNAWMLFRTEFSCVVHAGTYRETVRPAASCRRRG